MVADVEVFDKHRKRKAVVSSKVLANKQKKNTSSCHLVQNCKENQNQESRKARTVSDEAEHQSVPASLRTLLQIIESIYVPKDRYQNLEKEALELSSELARTKSRILELELQLALSEANRADFEKKSYLANENNENLQKRVEDMQSDLESLCHSELAYKSRIPELERELEVSEAKRVEYEKKISLANEGMKNLEKREADIHSDFRDSELAYKSQITELERELEVSEAKRADLEKRTNLACEDKKNLEKSVAYIQSDLESIRDSETAYKSRIQVLEAELEVSEAKRADYEKRTYLANEANKYLEIRVGDIHSDLESIRDSETAYKSQIQVLEAELEASETKRADYEKRTYLANEANRYLEIRVEDILSDLERIRDSEIAHKSRSRELERELEVSEATKANFEKRVHLGNEATKDLEKRVESIQSELVRIRDSQLASHLQIKELERDLELSEAKRVDFEKKAYLSNEAKKSLEKRIEDLNSGFDSQKNRDEIATDAVEAFKSSKKFLNLLQAATYYFDAIDSNFFNMSTDECGKSSGPVDLTY